MNSRLFALAFSVAAAILGASCSREPEPVANTAPQTPADAGSLQARSWVDDVQIGSAVTAQQTLLSHSLYSTFLTLHDELFSPLVPPDETKRNNIDSWLTPITAAI